MADDQVATADSPKGGSEPSPQGSSSSASPEQNGSSPQPPTFTSEQQANIDSTTAKAVNDALSAAGRTNAAQDAREKQFKADKEALEARQTAHQREVESAEDEAAKESPELLGQLRDKRAKAATQVQLDRQKTDLDARETAIAERERLSSGTAREQLVGTIATELNVDPKMLLSHGGDTEESLRTLAGALPKKAPPTATPEPDSGATSGGSDWPADAMGKIKAGLTELHAAKK